MNTSNRYTEKYNKLNEPELSRFEDEILNKLLDGQLNSEEKEWFLPIVFEKQIDSKWPEYLQQQINSFINSNPDIETQFELHKKASSYISNQKEFEIRQLIKEQRNNKSRQIRYGLLIAASIIVLVSIVLFSGLFRNDNFQKEMFVFNKQTDKHTIDSVNKAAQDKIYLAYYEPYKLELNVVRGDELSSDEINIMKIQAKKQLEEGNIEELENALIALNKKNPQDLQFKMNLASFYMQTENFKEAIFILKEVSNSNETEYSQIASWYLALCYLKTNDTKEATKLLEILQKTGEYNQKKVSELIDELSKIKK